MTHVQGKSNRKGNPKPLRRKTREKRGRKASPAPNTTRLRALVTMEMYQEFLDMERCMISLYRGIFSRAERMIIFCKVYCGWSRKKMANSLNISEYQVSKLTEKVRGLI